MSEAPNPDPSFAANAARELAQLETLVAEMRAVLAALHQDVAQAEGRLGQAAAIVEANEQLVLSALRSQADADTAAQALEEASRSARLDPLTGLPNRLMLHDRLTQAIAMAKRHDARLAILFLDLNDFKQINDTLGHATGDRVLKLVADRLAASVREADTVSRFGGDEFVFVLTEVSLASDVLLVANKVLAALATPVRIDDHVLRLAASIGVSFYPDDGNDADTLVERADTAMYRAKRLGLSGVVLHGDRAGPDEQQDAPALASLQRSLTVHETALAEHERQRAQLCEANEQLVLAALDAQELHAAAEQALQRQNELLALVAHELRNPLAPIRNAAAVIGQVRTNDPVLSRMQAIIERQVIHMTRLVGDLVDVSRVNTGKLRIERQLVDIVDIVDAAIEVSRPAMDTRLQRFIVQMPSRALKVHADPIRLSQVFSNLLDNASRYTPNGGEVRLSVDTLDEAVVVTVSDSGIGITAEALPDVFKAFVQDTHAIGFNGAGLGIGLTVARELVEAHGGGITASSPGRDLGSRFVVTLPFVEHRLEGTSPG